MQLGVLAVTVLEAFTGVCHHFIPSLHCDSAIRTLSVNNRQGTHPIGSTTGRRDIIRIEVVHYALDVGVLSCVVVNV